jgi:ferredoxin-NADP reductase/DMSO/TMAO reductase YedYZ heme-binding membrane subunit
VDVLTSNRSATPTRTRTARSAVRPRDLAAIALLGVVLLVVTWWRGAPRSIGPGAALTDAGRLTGFLAGYVALVQVVLRARLAIVERTLGTDAINACHRLFGSYLVVLVLTHATLITAGYAASLHTTINGELWSLLTRYPYVLWAAIGAGLLVVVGATSAPIVRRRLRYEVWHAIHLVVYAALVLAFFHQVTDGEHFVHSARLRAAWTALFVAVAVVMVWSRWLRPVLLMARHRLVIAAVHRETPGTVSIELAGRRLDRFPAEPGQYFRWRFLVRGRWWVAHPYSLSAEPDGRRLRITATVSGRHSSLLPHLPVGTKVIAEGPCGRLLAKAGWDGPVVLIAGGIGITPLRALFASAPSTRLTLVYRAHGTAALAFRSELDDIAAKRDASVHYLVGSRHEPANWLAPEQLAAMCPDIRDAQVYVCGSAEFVHHVRTSLAALGKHPRNVRTESFQL